MLNIEGILASGTFGKCRDESDSLSLRSYSTFQRLAPYIRNPEKRFDEAQKYQWISHHLECLLLLSSPGFGPGR
jgi:hypothetical protein